MVDELNLLSSTNTVKESSEKSIKRWAIPGIFGSIGLSIMAIAVPFTMPAFRRLCLPYVPATDAQVQNVISCLKMNGKRTLVDLGSGDGRIVSNHEFTFVFLNYNLIIIKGFRCCGERLQLYWNRTQSLVSFIFKNDGSLEKIVKISSF